jgi:hypothetical protein
MLYEGARRCRQERGPNCQPRERRTPNVLLGSMRRRSRAYERAGVLGGLPAGERTAGSHSLEIRPFGPVCRSGSAKTFAFCELFGLRLRRSSLHLCASGGTLFPGHATLRLRPAGDVMTGASTPRRVSDPRRVIKKTPHPTGERGMGHCTDLVSPTLGIEARREVVRSG